MSNRVIAGIVTFNPNIERLTMNINAIKNQVEQVIIVDNNSKNKNSLKNFESELIKVIYNEDNLGIAAALNIIMDYCGKNDFDWVVTLDQDSVCPEEYICKISELLNQEKIGQIVPVLYESNTHKYCMLSDKIENVEFQIVRKSITSAAITNYNAWVSSGKFDEGLFIDYVDFDFAFRIRKNGYKIVRANKILLDHQLGNSKLWKFGLINIRVPNYTPFRRYYISRNMIIFMRRYGIEGGLFGEMLRLIKMILITLLFEHGKKEKTKAILKGIKDGLKYEI